nr:glycosaminoglycan xylosylkinase homolog [Leptinotarsa decemlineata]
MIRQKRIFLLALGFLLLFLITTNYVWIALPNNENEVKKVQSIEEKIYSEMKKLPDIYKFKSIISDRGTDIFLKNIRDVESALDEKSLKELWREANSWVSKTQLVNASSPNLGKIQFALKHAKIIKADVDTRGTQLKILLTLQGNQLVVFKPKWYDKTKIVEGPVYAGKDRHASEILGFYLSIILKKPLCPISVERQISLKNDVLPVATKSLLETSYIRNNNTCVYGKCFFCKETDPVCDNNSYLSGAVIFNFNATLATHRSPWQRTYKKGKKALWQVFPESYCKTVKERISEKRLHDLIDISIFDFLIQNGDRHHYETLDDTVLWLDNGKGLGNPNTHHIDILAPLYQCCILRRETWKTLLKLTGGTIREHLEMIPGVKAMVTEDHLRAIEQRLLIVFATTEYCRHFKQSEHYLT